MMIFLYGPPGSGKTTVGQCLAGSLALPFVDLDREIEARAGISIPEIFESESEAGFRARENDMLSEVIARRSGVVALGGGALLNSANRSAVEQAGRVVCLRAPVDVLLSRLVNSFAQRPLVDQDILRFLPRLLDAREEHYASFLFHLDTSQCTPVEASWRIQTLLGSFHAAGMGQGYDIRVVRSGLEQVGDDIKSKNLKGPIAVVSDVNVAGLYAHRVIESCKHAGYTTGTVILPPGEQVKNMSSIQELWDGFLRLGMERTSTVIALGGGVIGDLAGFAAATYMRGISWAVLPTSLLAMVDASLGGKTGADLPQGKNLIGAFYPPVFVLTDPVSLSTLPEVEIRNGLAEIVKSALVGDAELFQSCKQGWGTLSSNWDKVICRSMVVKIKVIQADPYEKGIRASLNLGHTVGHALEKVTHYTLPHGFSVSIGMVVEARLAEALGLAQVGLAGEIIAVLDDLRLPVTIPIGVLPAEIIEAMYVDKKKTQGCLNFALPVKPGQVKIGVKIKDTGLIDHVIRQTTKNE